MNKPLTHSNTNKPSAKLLFCALCLSLLAAIAYADGPRPGLYKVTANITSSGIGPQGHTETVEQCVKEGQFDGDPRTWMGQSEPNQNCSVLAYTFEDGEVAMNMECAMPGGKANIVGQGTYNDRGFEMTNTMTMSAQGMDMKITTHVVGTHVGDC